MEINSPLSLVALSGSGASWQEGTNAATLPPPISAAFMLPGPHAPAPAERPGTHAVPCGRSLQPRSWLCESPCCPMRPESCLWGGL